MLRYIEFYLGNTLLIHYGTAKVESLKMVSEISYKSIFRFFISNYSFALAPITKAFYEAFLADFDPHRTAKCK